MRCGSKGERAVTEGVAGWLVFVREHDGQNARRLRQIGRVLATTFELVVIIIDLEIDPLAVVVEIPEIVFAVGIDFRVELVEGLDGSKDVELLLGCECIDAGRGHDPAACAAAPEFVIQFANCFCFGVCLRNGRLLSDGAKGRA